MTALFFSLLAFLVGFLIFRYLDKKSDAWIQSGNKYKRILGWCLLLLIIIGVALYLIATHV